MKSFKVTFLTGWQGGMLEDKMTVVFEAKDFEDAFRKAKDKEWHSDAYAKIIAIEEVTN